MTDQEKQVCFEILRLLYSKGLNNAQESMLALAFGQFLDKQNAPAKKEDSGGGK